MIFTLYIFDKRDHCIFYREWNRTRGRPDNPKEEEQLLSGMLKALKSFSLKTSPADEATVLSYCTSMYKMHYFESGNGLKFVLMTDPKAANMQSELQTIYTDYFVEYLSKNPLYTVGEPINHVLFQQNVDKYIKSLPVF